MAREIDLPGKMHPGYAAKKATRRRSLRAWPQTKDLTMQESQLRFTRLLTLTVSVLFASGQFLAGAPAASWSASPDLPTDLVRATGVYFPANGRFYAMGGRMSDTFGSDMTTPYEYNPKTNTWAFKTAPFPDNHVSNMACGVLTVGRKPYIYCVGGTAAGGTTTATKRVFRYDPATDTMQTAGLDPWNESAPDTVPGGFAVVQNKLYILGGLTVGSSATNRIFEFTPEQSHRLTVDAENGYAARRAEFRSCDCDRESHFHGRGLHPRAL